MQKITSYDVGFYNDNTLVVAASHFELGIAESAVNRHVTKMRKHVGYFTGIYKDKAIKIYIVTKAAIGSCTIVAKGSPKFVCWFTSEARKRGFLFNQYGLFELGTRIRVLGSPTEEMIFQHLEIPFVNDVDRWKGKFK